MRTWPIIFVIVLPTTLCCFSDTSVDSFGASNRYGESESYPQEKCCNNGNNGDGGKYARTDAYGDGKDVDGGGDDVEVDEHCKSKSVKEIIDRHITKSRTPERIARLIQGDMSKQFGGRAEVICSRNDFAYTIWYQLKQCKIYSPKMICLAWKD